MNQQDVFDRVVAHAREQGRRSMLPTGSCAYRGEDGTKCFIGALITDEAYERGLECQRVDSYEVREALAASGVSVDSPDEEAFLVALQRIHDAHVPLEVRARGLGNYWERQFEAFASNRGVVYTPPGKP